MTGCEQSERGAGPGVKARPSAGVSQGLLGSLLSLSGAAHSLATSCSCSGPDERLSRVRMNNVKKRKSGFLCYTSLPALSVVG